MVIETTQWTIHNYIRFRNASHCRGLKLAAIVAGLLSGTANAQADEPPNALGQWSAEDLEVITVTARKREESLQDSPVSITAVSSEGLERRSIRSFNQLSGIAPNVEINNGRAEGGGSTAQIFIRGVGQQDSWMPNEPGVGVYVDGVYVARSFAGDLAFMDVERLEILRGPQGTLYGKNTIGGAINLIMRKPDGDSTGELDVTYGRFDLVEVKARGETSITDDLWLRVAGMVHERDGYGKDFLGDELGDSSRRALRAVLRYAPEPGTDVTLAAEYSRQRQNGPVGAMLEFWPGDVANLANGLIVPDIAAEYGLGAPFNVYGPAWINAIADTERYVSHGSGDTWDDNDVWGASLVVEKSLDKFNLKSTTAYRDTEADVQRDGDHTPFPIFTIGLTQTSKQWTQELQFTGTALNKRMPWVLGLFGMKEDGFLQFRAPLLEGFYEKTGVDLSLLSNTKPDTESLAGYGEMTYYWTESLGLTLGARYAYEKKVYGYRLDTYYTDVSLVSPRTLSASWTEFLPKAWVEYKISPDLMAYASVSKGFKAGGWNPRSTTPGVDPQRFDPEFVTTYELGLKSTLWNGLATANAAVFYSDYKDIQLSAVTQRTLQDGTVVIDTAVDNGGKAELYGAELELVVRPTDPLALTAGLGLLDTKYRRLDETVLATGVSLDSKFIESPEVTFNAGIDYRLPAPRNNGSILLHADVTYKSEVQKTVQNSPALTSESFWIGNARVTYETPTRGFSVSGYVTNISDEIYLANGIDVRALGATEAYYSRPREWGITLTTRF